MAMKQGGHMIIGIGDAAANTSSVATTVFTTSPLKDSTVNLRIISGDDQVTTKSEPISSTFKLVMWMVAVITVIAGIAHVALAGLWLAPTPNQQAAFEAMGAAWKVGFGALVGLLGGKSL